MDETSVIRAIHEAFGPNEYPGDAFLQGSFDGCEPEEEVGPFRGCTDWRTLDAALLDAHADALSFFSDAGFRFFVPAFMIADVEERLQVADPLFHLTHGFYDATVELPSESGPITQTVGGSVLVNPRRYGAMTFHDYASCRLSVFTREEAGAIVAYLRHRRQADPDGVDAPAIDAALESFWLERASHAPTAEMLRRHCEAQERYRGA